MQLIVAVFVVRAIISMFDEKEKNVVEKNNAVMRIIHPAEFQIR